MTNSLGKKTNGGLLRYIDLVWRASILETRRPWEPITHGENKTRLWFYVYAHPLKSNLPSEAARDRILIPMHLAPNNERQRQPVVNVRNDNRLLSRYQDKRERGKKRERMGEVQRDVKRARQGEKGRRNAWGAKSGRGADHVTNWFHCSANESNNSRAGRTACTRNCEAEGVGCIARRASTRAHRERRGE